MLLPEVRVSAPNPSVYTRAHRDPGRTVTRDLTNDSEGRDGESINPLRTHACGPLRSLPKYRCIHPSRGSWVPQEYAPNVERSHEGAGAFSFLQVPGEDFPKGYSNTRAHEQSRKGHFPSASSALGV